MTTPAILAEVPLGRLSPGWDLWNDFQDGDRANPFKHKVMGDSPYEGFYTSTLRVDTSGDR